MTLTVIIISNYCYYVNEYYFHFHQLDDHYKCNHYYYHHYIKCNYYYYHHCHKCNHYNYHHYCNTDPFNRSPLTMKMIEPLPELKKKIELWIQEKLKMTPSAGSEKKEE